MNTDCAEFSYTEKPDMVITSDYISEIADVFATAKVMLVSGCTT